MTILIVGHVTKDGTIAGPKMLEHMVDTVLYMEGDDRYDHRILRSAKNRFGATHEVGIFNMDENGLREVANPSEMFLAERSVNIQINVQPNNDRSCQCRHLQRTIRENPKKLVFFIETNYVELYKLWSVITNQRIVEKCG